MKKLVFLLLMAVVLVGFVSAGAAHPPGVLTLEVNTLEAALSGYGVAEGIAITPDTALELVTPVTVDPSSLQVVMAHYHFSAIQPHNSFIEYILRIELSYTCATTGYYLRC